MANRDIRHTTARILAVAAAALVVAAAAPPPVAADVIVNPNQVVGDVAFTNANPTILNILRNASDVPPGLGFGLKGGLIRAASLPPQSPALSAYSLLQPFPYVGLTFPYTLSVESGPPGSGIAYTMSMEARTGRSSALGAGLYVFVPKASIPVEREPAPDVRVDFRECAGLFHVRFRDTLGQPVAVDGGTVSAFRETAAGSGLFQTSAQGTAVIQPGDLEIYDIVRGDDWLYRVKVSFQVGRDPELDLLMYEATLEARATCDQIVVLDVVFDPGTGGSLGAVIGNFDVLRESEHPTGAQSMMKVTNGPWGNYREHTFPTTPSSGPYLLPNVMPSDVVGPPDPYTATASACFRTGRAFAMLTTPNFNDVMVMPGATVDLGDTFVIDPGYLSSDIYLRAAAVRYPAVGSPLAALVFDPDSDGDGQPDRAVTAPYYSLSLSGLGALGSAEVAPGATASAINANASSQFEGGFDAGLGAVVGSGELVLGNLRQEPSYWSLDTIRCHFEAGSPAVPEGYIESRAHIRRTDRKHLMTPGSTVLAPHRYCFADLYVRFHATSGNLHSPVLGGTGTFSGADFEGVTVAYEVSNISALGSPRTTASAAPDGLVVATLPAAVYRLQPRVSVGASSVNLAPFDIELGCGESYDEWLDLLIALDSRPDCIADPTLAISGSVSGGATVSAIEYRVNAGLWLPVCAACGVDPPFSFVAAIAPGSNTIEVLATESGGRQSSVIFAVTRAGGLADYGNVLLAVEEGLDVRFHWRLPAGAAATEVRRDVLKPFAAPAVIGTAGAPATSWPDPGVLSPSAGMLLFYRVGGRDCAGASGP